MMKVKSRSRELRESAEVLSRYAINRRSASKENRLVQTADHRNYSNQYLPHAHHFDHHTRTRDFSSAKNCRKQSQKPIEIQHHPQALRSPYQHRRPHSSKNFIGCKLRKKLQKYLLFLSLVNYSLRVSYQRPESNRYRVYVGKGNNSKLVKSLFASRFWWQLTDQQSEAQLVWTQRSRKKVFRIMDETDLLQQQQREVAMEVVVGRKAKGKREKRSFCEQFQSILCEKDRQAVRGECGRENFQEELRGWLRRWKQQRRKAVRVTHNHIENHRLLTNKKSLFFNFKQFCEQQHDDIFKYVPLTFHIRTADEKEYAQLLRYQESELKKEKEKLMWIVKPGQNSNRGCGIEVCKKVEQVRKHIQKCLVKHPERTFIVQKYISPYLFHRRKFDIRCFVLVTATPLVSAYFYPCGYLRTSSFEFSLKNCSNKYIHLTNDAIQKKASDYSKYESGNKITFEAFQKYLDLFHPHPHPPSFLTHILPQIKQLVALSIKSARNFHNSSKEHTFQIMGYDFMLDEDLHPWLIQINTNPCLQTNCEVLQAIIPAMLENAIKIAVDPVFKPPKMDEWTLKELLGCPQPLLQGNKFQLIYSQLHDC